MYVGIPEASPLDFCVFSRLDLLIANHFPKVSRLRILLCSFWVFQATSPPRENLPESPLRADSYAALRRPDSPIYTTPALNFAAKPCTSPAMTSPASVAVGSICLLLLSRVVSFYFLKLRRRPPPGPPGLPLVGNVRDIPAPDETPWLKYHEWCREYSESPPRHR